jgi:hypothetical protein
MFEELFGFAPCDVNCYLLDKRKTIGADDLGVLSRTIVADRNLANAQAKRPSDDRVSRFVVSISL